MKRRIRTTKTQPNIQYNPKKRLPAIVLLAVFLFTAVFVKMFAVMVVESKDLQLKAVDQWMRDLPTDAKRGSILDANGKELAVTSTRYNLYVRPSATKDKEGVAKLLSRVFGYDYDKILAKISKRTSEVTVASKVTKEQLNEIYAAKLDGIYYAEDNFRYYPYGDFMTQILGFCSSDGYGQTGIEAYYDEYLTGVNGKIMTETDLVGREIGGGNYYLPSIAGMDVVTTLDSGIQSIIDGAIRKAVDKFDPKAVTCIVMDYTDGQIKALSEYPSFDLNAVPRDDLEKLFLSSKCNAVSSVYEPGSTFKILTAAAALDAGKVNVSDRFYCSGSRLVDGQKIRCWKAKGHGSIDFGGGVEGSCNCVFMDCALRLGTESFYDYMAAFGLTKKTGVDIKGETHGIFIDKANVKPVDLARIGFGHAVAITPMELITATSAVINGGNTVTPHLLTGLMGKDGNLITPTSANNSVRVVSPETSDIMRNLLGRVVTNGSGKGAYVPGYTVVGKTGTAQKYSGGAIAGGKYISSFLGFSLNPKANLAVLFIVDEPKGYTYYGSQVAAPLVGEIFKSIFDYLDVKPNYTGEEKEIIGEEFILPDFTGMSLIEAKNALYKLGLYVEIDGDGDKVTSQYPLAGVKVDKRNAVLLMT